MNLTPSAWYGILAAIGAVIAAYLVGFSAGRNMGRGEGFSDGRREGAKEGSARGYAVGFDRGRRKNEGGDDSPSPSTSSTPLLLLIGLVLAGAILFIFSQLDRGRVEEPHVPGIDLPAPLLPPPSEPSIDG